MKRLLLLWLASLVLVSMTTFAIAQTRPLPPRVLSGNDIGFRVEGVDPKGKPIGTLMVRFNGDWIEVGASMIIRPVK
jgi:hypothetical protein